MPLGSIAPVLARIHKKFGAASRIYQRDPASPRRADGSSIDNWIEITPATGLSVVVAQLSQHDLYRAWGADTQAVAQATFPIPAAGGFVVEPQQTAIIIDVGMYAGQSFVILDAKIDDVGRIATVALRRLPAPIDALAMDSAADPGMDETGAVIG